MKIKILLFFFIYFLSIHALYAFSPCNENISKQDKQSYEVLELNPPLFQCSFNKEQSLWQYNQTLQKDYDATLKELQSNFPTLTLTQAKGLRYAIYIQDSLNTIKKHENTNNKNTFGKILGSLTFTQTDISNIQQAIDFYYKQAIDTLNTQERENLYLKLYGESQSIAILQQAKDSKTFTKEQITKAKEDNAKILQQIQDIINLDFKNESEEILYVDIVNNLAFIYNANLLINEGKDYQERQHKAYDDSKALELLELLSIFIGKIHNKEHQFIALQGSLITIQGAIMSIPIHTPFTKEDYENMSRKKEYIEHYSNLLKLDGVATMSDKFNKLNAELLQTDAYSQIQTIFQKFLTKIDSVYKVSKIINITDSDFVKRIFAMLDYQDKYLN